MNEKNSLPFINNTNVRGEATQGRTLCVNMECSNLEKSAWSGFWSEIAGKSSHLM